MLKNQKKIVNPYKICVILDYNSRVVNRKWSEISLSAYGKKTKGR